MTLPKNILKATYRDPGIEGYRGNSFIEALPPIMTTKDIKKGIQGNITMDPKDIFEDANKRVHIISQLLDDYFQPLSNHLQLEVKISIMIRQGYVGRNYDDGSLNMHMQNGYERVQSGDLTVHRFEQVKSTARSFALIGSSGCGKSTTLNRIFGTYPQALYHKKFNFTQIVYLKMDCPFDGSLANLCINFFRAVDALLHTNYEKKYAEKRIKIETLLAKICQIANVHALGVLVIDEIQHLSLQKSGGSEKMLNFFVTLVNTIGLPVILVGTPKARDIFEKDFRSARRSTGLGASFWGPMKEIQPKINKDTGKKIRTEWIAFTDNLWKYQWLQKKEESIPEDIRSCLYDLSQGVHDIIIKLFVLAQLRAIVTKIERITTTILKRVYEDEFKPVHPMLDALRSEDPERIKEYSDLRMPEIDKQLLELSQKISEYTDSRDEKEQYDGNDEAKRLHNLLIGMDCESEHVVPLVKLAFEDHPKMTIQELIPIVLEWYKTQPEKKQKNKKEVNKYIKNKDWHTLDSDDLRFIHSQSDSDNTVYKLLKEKQGIFDIEDWLKKVS